LPRDRRTDGHLSTAQRRAVISYSSTHAHQLDHTYMDNRQWKTITASSNIFPRFCFFLANATGLRQSSVCNVMYCG